MNCGATLSVNGQMSKCQETGAHDVHTSAAGSWTAGAEQGGRPDWVRTHVVVEGATLVRVLRKLKRGAGGKDLGLL